MKLKGIKPIEQHLEKAVVGAVGLGLLGVLAWQFLSPTKIKVGRTEQSIAGSFGPAEQAARALEGQLDDATPELPKIPEQSGLNGFESMLTAPVGPTGKIAPLGMVVSLGASAGALPMGEVTFAALPIPAPGAQAAAGFRGTIDPREILSHPELRSKNLVPAEQPFDKAAVSVQASFNGKALRSALETDPDGAGPAAAFPTDWWLGRLEIVGVEVQREERDASGNWVNPTMIDPIPGQYASLAEWNKNVKSATDVVAQIDRVRRNAQSIQRHPFYQMMVGQWAMPTVLLAREAANFDPQRYETLSLDLSTKQNRLQEVENELAQLPTNDGRSPAPEPAPRRRDDGGGGGGKGVQGPGSGPNRNPNPNPEPNREETPQQKRGRLQGEQRRLTGEIDVLRRELGQMGGAPLPEPATNSGQPAATPPMMLDNESIQLLAHDMTAVPGNAYRYRLRVVVNNPVYGKEGILKENDAAQQELAKTSLLRGAWSEWTNTVEVDRDAYWFITSATANQTRSGLNTAKAELYQFYYGYYRRAEVSLEPGDALVGRVKLPKLFLVDEATLAANPQTPQPAPEEDRGGKGARPERMPQQGSPTPGQPEGQGAPTQGPPAKEELVFQDTASVLLLDVRPVPGELNRLQTVLRGLDGRMVVRTPEGDRAVPAYERVRRSAEMGARQNQPKPTPRQAPVQREPEPEETPTNRGGGGGGGGG
jgi:hypothetical protein